MSGQQTLRKTVRLLLIALLIILWSSAASIITDFLIIPILHHRTSFNIYSWAFYISITLLSLFITVLPVWRFSIWLNAVTYGEAQNKDLDRVLAWITASQFFYVFLMILYDLSFSGIFSNELNQSKNTLIFHTQQAYFLFQIPLFQYVKAWMVKTQHLQTQTKNRKTELHPLYLKIWPFTRIIQVLQLLTTAALFISDTPYSSLGLILLGISSITSIYALELALRLANIMEQDKPNMPRLAHS